MGSHITTRDAVPGISKCSLKPSEIVLVLSKTIDGSEVLEWNAFAATSVAKGVGLLAFFADIAVRSRLASEVINASKMRE